MTSENFFTENQQRSPKFRMKISFEGCSSVGNNFLTTCCIWTETSRTWRFQKCAFGEKWSISRRVTAGVIILNPSRKIKTRVLQTEAVFRAILVVRNYWGKIHMNMGILNIGNFQWWIFLLSFLLVCLIIYFQVPKHHIFCLIITFGL